MIAKGGVLYKKGGHGDGFRCLPEWLCVECRPCPLAMRAV